MTKPAQDRSCKATRENIPWYVNGTLSNPAAAEILHHVRDCSECRADLDLHADMCAAVRSQELMPIIPATRPEAILDKRFGADRQARSPTHSLRIMAAAASVAIIGLALLLHLYERKDTETGNQLFQTATSAGTSDGIDYVLQLQLDAGMTPADAAQITSQLAGVTRWTVNENGSYEVHVRLAAASLQDLQEYESHAETIRGVQSAKFTALQLPIR
ncbi:MAG: zf-HC2 domain-containing protein [Gammaproteobacteria bacterium]|nr:zf-HC2 domain-containing protein [Gammaproteobacteria bacterium]MDH5303521.1 zf-HC2 domain-containing protein [Gammaproteobacteria bacterium]MDH5321863.1 zf-HC2 domain-containing protein [Gammaproteobacteria bacterium]